MTTLSVTITGKQSVAILQNDKVNDNLHVITLGNKKGQDILVPAHLCFYYAISGFNYFPKYLSNKPFNALPCLASSLAIS